MTARGLRFFSGLGIDIERVKSQRRAFARRDLDWSERRHHLGGALGAALTSSLIERQWLRRCPGDRRIELTPAGRLEIAALFPALGLDCAEVR